MPSVAQRPVRTPPGPVDEPARLRPFAALARGTVRPRRQRAVPFERAGARCAGARQRAAAAGRQLVEPRRAVGAGRSRTRRATSASSTTAARAACIPISAARHRRAASTIYGMPYAVVDGAQAKSAVTFQYATRATASTLDRPGLSVLSDPDAVDHAAALGRGRRARQRRPAQQRRPPPADGRLHEQRPLRALQRLVRRLEGQLVRRLGRVLRPRHRTAPARRLDLGRCRRACDLSRPGALRRGVQFRGRRDRPRLSCDRACDQRLRLAGLAPRRQHDRRVAASARGCV